MSTIQLFEIYGTILLNSDQFNRGIGEATGKAEGLTGKVKNLVETVAGVKVVSAAFDMVRDSIGSAVDRVDTLNRFPKIMELMGFSAEQAAASTEELRDGILGLPTALDEIVANTQKLATLTGNLESATDTTLALNNAFLASGSSAEDASRGLNQYVQQLSKGEVDLVSWRTLQETMGFALREVSEEMLGVGATSNELYDALQDGAVTFDELNSKIVELSTRAGGFADMAQEAAGGIGTSWTNMGTAVTRGTASIITAIDEGLSETRFGSIQNVIEGFGEGFENTLKGIAGAVKPVAENLDTLVPILGVATAAFVGFKATIAISGIIQETTASFAALNAVMLANPVALVVAGLAALTAALVININKSKELYGATGDLLKSSRDITQAVEDSRAAYEEKSGAIETDIALTQKLANEITELSNREAKSIDEKGRLATLVNMLNEAMGENVLQYDAENDALSKTVDQIGKLVEARAEQARAAAAQERATEIAKEQMAAEEKLNEIQTARAEAQRVLNDAIARGEVNLGDYNIAVETLKDEEAALKVEIEALDSSFESAMQASSKYITITNNNADATENLASIQEQMQKSYAELSKSVKDATADSDLLTSSLEEQEKTGHLNLSTVDELTQAGYALAVQIDEETGKVVLNKEAYIELASAKIDEMIASAKIDRANIVTQLVNEQNQALLTASAYSTEAKAIYEKIIATEKAAHASSAYIAELENTKNSLGKTTAETKKLGGATKKASDDIISATKASIEQRKFYEQLSAGEVIQLWRDVTEKFVEGTEERYKADKELAAAISESAKEQENILGKMIKLEDDYTKALNDRAQAIISSFINLGEVDKIEQENTKTHEKAIETVEKLTEDIEALNEKRIEGNLTAKESKKLDEELTQKQEELATATEKLTAAEVEANKSRKQIMQETMNEQVDALRQYEESLGTLFELDIDDELKNQIHSMGAAAVPEIQGLVDMTETELEAYQEAWREGQEIANRLAIEEMQPMRVKMVEEMKGLTEDLYNLIATESVPVGEMLGEGFWEGLENSELTEKTEEHFISIVDAVKNALGIHSPSTVFMEIGDNMMLGAALGIEQNTAILETIDQTTQNMFDRFKEAITTKEWPQLGDSIIDGITAGLQRRIDDMLEAFNNALDRMIAGAMEKLDAHSPSRVFMEIGEFVGDGFIIGMENRAPAIYAMAQQIAAQAAAITRSTLGISSPSKVFEEIGEFTGQGFINGLENMASRVAAVVGDTFSGFDAPPIGAVLDARAHPMRSISNSEVDIAGRQQPVMVNQHIQAVPQTAAELASATAAAFQVARWAIP